MKIQTESSKWITVDRDYSNKDFPRIINLTFEILCDQIQVGETKRQRMYSEAIVNAAYSASGDCAAYVVSLPFRFCNVILRFQRAFCRKVWWMIRVVRLEKNPCVPIEHMEIYRSRTDIQDLLRFSYSIDSSKEGDDLYEHTGEVERSVA